jgi:hypothetical protein
MILHTSEGRTWQSSLIKSTEYTPDTKELRIVFSNDIPYVYKDVLESEYEEFCKAESQGSYFIKTFRGKKEFTKIEITDENRNHQG